MDFEQYKIRVENLIQRIINGTDEPYKDFVIYSLKGGKRVRPIISLSILDTTLKKDRLAGSVIDAIEMACMASELIHVASLLLDDLPCMDNACTRRGLPPMHVRFGEASSIMTSAHLMMQAVQLFTNAAKELNKYNESTLCTKLANACVELIHMVTDAIGFAGASGGQMMDLKLVKDIDIDKLIAKKTACLFEIAFMTGYMMSDSAITNKDKVLLAAKHFGMAYQIYDDFKDIIEDTDTNNYVKVWGKAKAFHDFTRFLDECAANLFEVGLLTDVIRYIINKMRSNLEKDI